MRRLAGAALLTACAFGCADKAPAAPARVACEPLPEVPLLALAGAEEPPALLWAAGGARLSLDGAAVFGSPEAPARLSVGPHLLRVEAQGQEPLVYRFRAQPFVPAMFHAQVDEGAGLTLVMLGVTCQGCAFPDVAPDFQPLPRSLPVKEALGGAAAALRTSGWVRALAFLRQVPPAARRSPLSLRLEARVRADALDDQARAVLASIPAKSSNDLSRLLSAHAALQRSERARRGQVLLARWNKLAERFGALVSRFQGDAPAAVAAHSRRFEALSRAYALAARDGPPSAEQEVMAGAEATVRALARDIRAARPDDCALGRDVLGALVR